MAENTHPYRQLQKLSAINSAEELESFLNLIWRTRKSGLSDAEKSSVQSLLNLPVLDEVDPVLVCIRSLIRKTLHESFVVPDIVKLFPPDLSMRLQRMLMSLFEKYSNQWKEEQSMDQHVVGCTRNSYRVNAMLPPHLTPVSCLGTNVSPIGVQSDTSQLRQTCSADACSSESLESVPQLQSITWTLGKPNTAETNREAIVCLKSKHVLSPKLAPLCFIAIMEEKLQDISKSPSGETEVKFRLTRDAIDAVIQSLACFSENLSNPDSEPQQKRPRQ